MNSSEVVSLGVSFLLDRLGISLVCHIDLKLSTYFVLLDFFSSAMRESIAANIAGGTEFRIKYVSKSSISSKYWNTSATPIS